MQDQTPYIPDKVTYSNRCQSFVWSWMLALIHCRRIIQSTGFCESDSYWDHDRSVEEVVNTAITRKNANGNSLNFYQGVIMTIF